MFSDKNHRTHWQWYKSFFSITILKYLVTWFAIVPLFVKVIEGINEPIPVQTAKETVIKLNLSLPFYWELLWASSLCFVIALLLYHIFCPPFIKTYNSFGDYKRFRHSPRWIVWESLVIINDSDEIAKLFKRLDTKKYIKLTQRDFEKNSIEIEETQTTAYFKFNDIKYSLSLPIMNGKSIDSEQTEIAEREIFWEVFGRFSSSNKTVRIIIVLLLIASGILFGIVFIQNILTGIEYIMK